MHKLVKNLFLQNVISEPSAPTRCSLIIAIESFESGFTIGKSAVECRSKV